MQALVKAAAASLLKEYNQIPADGYASCCGVHVLAALICTLISCICVLIAHCSLIVACSYLERVLEIVLKAQQLARDSKDSNLIVRGARW